MKNEFSFTPGGQGGEGLLVERLSLHGKDALEGLRQLEKSRKNQWNHFIGKGADGNAI